ncbi:ComEC/Rec2 family competence protein [Patescibacteria group bacterium]|nr:ComEC/Rec2 family competence protein [Patescibacteria group bacterium]
MRKIKPFWLLILLTLIAARRVFTYCNCDLSACFDKEHVLETPLFFMRIRPTLEKMRQAATSHAKAYLPSPHSELLLGMVVGLDYFSKLPFFKKALIDTGTIHVVVVSGFNISLVYSLVWKLLGSFYDRKKFFIGIAVALLYAGLSGFEPPVVRSWVMGTLAYLGKHYGRSFPALKLVFVSALLMILWQPAYLFSLSFQLSLSATLSLLLFTGIVERIAFISKYIPSLFREDFITTVAAQILVWPILSYYFGRVSLVSVVVNTFVLWTVSISTILGGLFLFTIFLGDTVARIFAFIAYIPLDFFVNTVQFFADISLKWGIAQLDFQISSKVLFLYYFVLLLLLFLRGKKSSQSEFAFGATFSSIKETSPDITTSNQLGGG